MGLVSVRSDQYAPSITKTFTTFAAVQTLHEAVGKSATGAAPAGINHLPSTIWVEASAADVLAWTDAQGTANSKTFVAAFIGALPFTVAALAATTTVDSVTVAWHPSGA